MSWKQLWDLHGDTGWVHTNSSVPFSLGVGAARLGPCPTLTRGDFGIHHLWVFWEENQLGRTVMYSVNSVSGDDCGIGTDLFLPTELFAPQPLKPML